MFQGNISQTLPPPKKEASALWADDSVAFNHATPKYSKETAVNFSISIIRDGAGNVTLVGHN